MHLAHRHTLPARWWYDCHTPPGPLYHPPSSRGAGHLPAVHAAPQCHCAALTLATGQRGLEAGGKLGTGQPGGGWAGQFSGRSGSQW